MQVGVSRFVLLDKFFLQFSFRCMHVYGQLFRKIFTQNAIKVGVSFASKSCPANFPIHFSESLHGYYLLFRENGRSCKTLWRLAFCLQSFKPCDSMINGVSFAWPFMGSIPVCFADACLQILLQISCSSSCLVENLHRILPIHLHAWFSRSVCM